MALSHHLYVVGINAVNPTSSSHPRSSTIGGACPVPARAAILLSLLGTVALRTVSLTVIAMLFIANAHGQQSDDPSDASIGLAFTTATIGEVAVCTLGSLTTGGTLNGTTNTAMATVPAPPCGIFTNGTTRDAWYRIDVPGAGDHRFRITIVADAINGLANGAMAAYTAPSAAGPFELIDCATGGNPTSGQFSNPSLEVTCVAPGSKVYVRIWDETAALSTRNFSVCVQGQIWNGTQQAIADTPCDVTTPLTVGAALATYYNTFACNETFPWDPSCGVRRSGDVWFSVVVPTSGSVNLNGAFGANAARRATRMGFTLYTTAGTCSDLEQFTEVACANATLTSSETVLASARCLVPGSTLWIRAYSTADALITPARFGAFRIRVTNPGGSPGTIANNLPCTASPLSFAATCPTYTSGTLGFNVGGCLAPGVPAPGCGILGTTTPDVWYSFIAPANGTVAIRVNGDNSALPAFNASAALYTAGNNSCDGPLTLVECDDRHGPGMGSYIIRTDLEPGVTYYLRVWGEGSSGTQTGIFYICLTSPEPPVGYCYYVINLTNENTAGSQTMRMAIGTDTVDYVTSTSPNDPSQRFLVAVPTGVTATFIYYNNGLSGAYTFGVTRLGERTPLWTYTGGVAVIGPTPTPAFQYTIVSTCGPIINAREDCLGSTTICGPDPVVSNTAGNAGSIVDLTAENRGCLRDEYNGGSWFLFRANADGRVSFWLEGTTAITDDLDFAIWDAGNTSYSPSMPNVTRDICSPTGPPIRCSSARVNGRTGLDAGYTNRYTEGTNGFSWLTPLDVQTDHIYILYVASIQHNTLRNFQLRWSQLLNDAGAPDNTLLDCTPIVLPVELLFLRADASAATVDVTWATASERNSSHFFVERSTDAIDFTPIGKVDAAGHSQSRKDYAFVDVAPLMGANFYRLRQVDIDGTEALSEVVVVLFKSTFEEPLIHPNPTTDALTLSAYTTLQGTVTTHVHDAMGRAVLELFSSAMPGTFQQRIDVSTLPSGTYTIRITGADGQPLGHTRLVKL